MVRSRLNNFLNKNIWVQYVFQGLCFFLFVTYILFYSFDLTNVIYTSIENSHLILNDSSIECIDNYELIGKNLKINGEEYKDVGVTFYGISTEDRKVYFSTDSNTLIQHLPKSFGVAFMFSSNMFVVVFALVFVVIGTYLISSNDKLNLKLFTKVTFRFYLALLIIYIITIVCTFVVLY